MLHISQMKKEQLDWIYQSLQPYDIKKPYEYIERCWHENLTGERKTFIAMNGSEFAGWGHIIYQSNYYYFAEHKIPEIQNFDVIPPYRKQGVGTKLMDEMERVVFEKYPILGIGFGLYKEYGPAQTMYIKRGYIPDGNGISYDGIACEKGERVPIDDSLALYLIKER